MMDFNVKYLSFFVIKGEEEEQSGSSKSFKHFQTLEQQEYLNSEVKSFLDSEFVRIMKRKVQKHPNREQTPTKIGHFIVEPGHELSSNPNYNLFQRLLFAEDRHEFGNFCDEMVRMYMDTSSVRGGAFIVASAVFPQYFDEPFLFIMKCDFEPKIARISDEKSLINQVEMAISARNIKSIQYPHMPEVGMREEHELKIHQASHARYFEDFLKFVRYEKSMPEIVNEQMVGMVNHYIEQKWSQVEDMEKMEEGRKQEEEAFELWSSGEKRELLERWSHEQVMEASMQLVNQKEDLELKLKLDGIQVKGLLSQFGSQIHIARRNGKYMVLLEGDSFEFEKGMSPVELLQPEELHQVIDRLQNKETKETDSVDSNSTDAKSRPPWD